MKVVKLAYLYFELNKKFFEKPTRIMRCDFAGYKFVVGKLSTDR